MVIVAEQNITPVEPIDVLGVRVLVKREDLNHPVVQGNKRRKLKYNLIKASHNPGQTVLTFGGAYSNHLLATAFAAQEQQLKAIGVVRGDELQHNHAIWSDTLYHCQRLGMVLTFISRSEYRQKEQGQTVKAMLRTTPDILVIPEGGSNDLAVKGVAELVTEIDLQGHQPSHLICPVGTGGTLAGLVRGVGETGWNCEVIGVAVLKGLQTVNQDITQWLAGHKAARSWRVLHDYHCGGYAKSVPELARFSVAFAQQQGFELDKIYNSKAFYALAQMIKSGQLTAHDQPMIIHTGGLQGGTFQP
ncbi:1-aminocyclopropane-1-carboxylate deaminase/D-cysteine desulfhydrase [Marinicella sediminis]|uniref:1-aminocyclopropane-1-carboxylate deaminase/D-cysteine desulfhydrase n=1 Tax=Marinicella sediminis TaxID=1792834 RepID=A0ABV7JD62_9GAMM|nr:pyridoxal-phosphate dependent enzyme [Marinicella sediminis]